MKANNRSFFFMVDLYMGSTWMNNFLYTGVRL